MLDERNGLPLFRFDSFPTAGVTHGISTRHGGVSPAPYDTLNQSYTVADDPALVWENRRRFAAALGFEPGRMVGCRQVHGDEVLAVDDDHDVDSVPNVDIQITDRPGWLLSLRFADCVPVLLVDPERRAIAAVHAGWRGTQRRAAATAVRALEERYGVAPERLRVGIGPSIGPCCYEVGEEVARQFSDRSIGILRTDAPKPRLDLWELNRAAVVAAGVPTSQVEVAGICTKCRSDLFFSHRAHGFPNGRFSAAIGLI